MAAYFPFSIITEITANRTVAVSKTNQVISVAARKLESGDARDLFIIAEVSAVSGVAGVIKMQQCHRQDGTFVDVAAATITINAAGVFKIEYNKVDGSGSALLPYIRIVATTTGADAFTVDRLYKTERNN